MPELMCNANVVGESNQNCIDIEKANALLALDSSTKNKYYQSSLQYATLTLYRTYPNATGNMVLYDKKIPKAESTLNTLVPVSIYDPKDKSYGMGFLSVDTYCCATTS